MMDLLCSCAVVASLSLMLAAYAGHRALVGRAGNNRLEGVESALLGRSTVEAAYWCLGPMVGCLEWLHISPNMVTALSLVPTLGAATAVGMGHLGIGAVLATVGSVCDLLDGVLARRQGIASDAGEVLDAAVDRYSEFLILVGIAVYGREHLLLLLLAMAALLGSFMVSYATAKAEAMKVVPPKGTMRRPVRAVYVIGGMTLVPCWSAWGPDGLPKLGQVAPLILSLAIVAVLSNASAIRRLYLTALRTRDSQFASPAGGG